MPLRHEKAICLGLVTMLCGCLLSEKSRVTNRGACGKLANTRQAESIRISYRTNSDRLNVSAVDSCNSLPNMTSSQLHLHYPHPNGQPEMALAMLIVAPQESDSGWLDRWHDKGSDPDEVLDRHVMDVPARNLHAIVDKLQQENFFRRSKPLVSESHLGVMMDDVRFAKDYRSVAELDAMILKVYRESRSGLAVPHRPISIPATVLRRLPATAATSIR